MNALLLILIAAQTQESSAAGVQQAPPHDAAFPTSEPAGPPETADQLKVQRHGATLLNPAIAVILDSYLGFYAPKRAFLAAGLPPSEEDPAFGQQGVGIQETELAFQAAIDPYFEGSLFLTNPNLEGFAVEEGFLVTTGLPWNLQVKAGIFRSQVGRNNEQHLHVQQLTLRPLLTTLLFGRDGLRSPGAQISVLLPLPWFATLYAEIFSVAAPEDPGIRSRLGTFGGGDRSDAGNVTATAVLEQFWDLTPNTSLLVGANAATGRAFLPCPTEPCALGGPRDLLLGGDVYLKWQPPNTAESYAALQWTTEYFARLIDGGPTEGALYTEPVIRFARRWHAGARVDLTGLPGGPNLPRRYGLGGAVTFEPSEFSLVRAYFQEIAGSGIPSSTVAFLQVQFAMGAHGAHAF